MSAEPRLSVAAPCYNEEDGIETVVSGWVETLRDAPFDWEIVVANDGSTDSTPAILERLHRQDARVRVVHLAHNAGYGRALSTAIGATRGEYVATIDSDGQFDLADGLELLEHADRQGLDAVTGRRAAKNDSPVRVAADRALNRLVRSLFGVALLDTNCALKVVRGDLLRAVPIEGRGFVVPTEIVLRLAAAGARMDEREVRHLERVAGTSKLRALEAGWSMARFLCYLKLQLSLQSQRVLDPRAPT
jgi:glycosyltransferase involved in cell wall biosynthesis